jgi:hypothetical protein
MGEMDRWCPECGGIDHTEIDECPHLTAKEKKIWKKAEKRGYNNGYRDAYYARSNDKGK